MCQGAASQIHRTPPTRPQLRQEPTVNVRSAGVRGPRVVERDRRILEAVCKLGIVTRDQFRELMVIHGDSDSVGIRTVNDRLAKLASIGCVTRDPWLRGSPYLVLPTRKAAALVGWPFQPRRPSMANQHHDIVVAEVCVSLLRKGLQWTSERELKMRASQQHRLTHIPDGSLESSGRECAIEVELNRKATHRWNRILRHHVQRFDEVHYYVDASVAGALERVIRHEFAPMDRDRIKLFPAPKVVVA